MNLEGTARAICTLATDRSIVAAFGDSPFVRAIFRFPSRRPDTITAAYLSAGCFAVYGLSETATGIAAGIVAPDSVVGGWVAHMRILDAWCVANPNVAVRIAVDLPIRPRCTLLARGRNGSER